MYYQDFYLIDNGTGQTVNQWLKRTILKKSFSIQLPNFFYPSPLDTDNTSILNSFYYPNCL
jgi:hypothetical protein